MQQWLLINDVLVLLTARKGVLFAAHAVRALRHSMVPDRVWVTAAIFNRSGVTLTSKNMCNVSFVDPTAIGTDKTITGAVGGAAGVRQGLD